MKAELVEVGDKIVLYNKFRPGMQKVPVTKKKYWDPQYATDNPPVAFKTILYYEIKVYYKDGQYTTQEWYAEFDVGKEITENGKVGTTVEALEQYWYGDAK
jgi:hypothetical protein